MIKKAILIILVSVALISCACTRKACLVNSNADTSISMRQTDIDKMFSWDSAEKKTRISYSVNVNGVHGEDSLYFELLSIERKSNALSQYSYKEYETTVLEFGGGEAHANTVSAEKNAFMQESGVWYCQENNLDWREIIGSEIPPVGRTAIFAEFKRDDCLYARKDKIGNRECEKYTVYFTEETIRGFIYFFAEEFVITSPATLLMSTVEFQRLVDNTTATIWIDTATGYLVREEIDLSELMHEDYRLDAFFRGASKYMVAYSEEDNNYEVQCCVTITYGRFNSFEIAFS